MGSYVYTLRKKIFATTDRGNIGVMKYAFKPYWDVFDAVEASYVPSWFDDWQKKCLKCYRSSLTRAINLPHTSFFIIEYDDIPKHGSKYAIYKTPSRHYIVDDDYCCDNNLVGCVVFNTEGFYKIEWKDVNKDCNCGSGCTANSCGCMMR